jgi:hypothetical protein
MFCKICHANGTQAPTDVQPIPGALRNIANPTLSDMIADGWREYVPSVLPNIKSSTWVDTGTKYVQSEVVQWTQEELDAIEAERKAAEEAARLASFQPLIPVASLYRATLRKHFGDNAETNHDVTKSSVSAYFEQKRMAQTITAVETADALALTMYFDILAAWNGTGETWTLPYQVVP